MKLVSILVREIEDLRHEIRISYIIKRQAVNWKLGASTLISFVHFI